MEQYTNLLKKHILIILLFCFTIVSAQTKSSNNDSSNGCCCAIIIIIAVIIVLCIATPLGIVAAPIWAYLKKKRVDTEEAEKARNEEMRLKELERIKNEKKKAEKITYLYEEAHEHEKIGMIRFAIKDYIEITKIDKKDVTARVWLGDRYLNLHEYNHAIEEYSSAIALNPENADELYYKKGLCYGSIGEMDDALSCISNALMINQNHEGALLLKDKIVHIQEEAEKARNEEIRLKELERRLEKGGKTCEANDKICIEMLFGPGNFHPSEKERKKQIDELIKKYGRKNEIYTIINCIRSYYENERFY